MRPSRDVATEIEAVVRRLRNLQCEHIHARLAERDEIVRLFCDGLPPDKIGRQLGMTRGTVAGVLYRVGYTIRGQHRIARKLDDTLRNQLRPVPQAGRDGPSLSPVAGPSGALAPPHTPASAPSIPTDDAP